ncbi:hypothetical protein ANN_08509 [Periplaneta americana]|uniref:FH2 domain-containing protein n=1 Tax=Periplaneta americana TaxID=6978 RepID=A0ABQ8T1L8_PERAM|nr:hypothetical protein ANN_08509 [Periplaneta americana]
MDRQNKKRSCVGKSGNDAETDQKEEKELAGSLVEKKLSSEGCTGRNDEELAMIRDHVGSKPDVPLDKPEQFLIELAEIPNFADRIACFMFQSEFDDAISSIENKLNNLKSTCQFLTTSESLKTVLAIILALGNYMNGGNRTRGQADGFGLEILAKLRDVKSKDSSVTLLHFIVRTYMKKCEDPLSSGLALPIPEPGDIDRAATVHFDDVDGDLKKLQKELAVCETRTKEVLAASTDDNIQPFKDKMEKFLVTANKQLNGELENLEECKQKFKATMQFYHYHPKGGTESGEVDPKDFFALWSPFCSDFKDIWKKEQQRLIKEKTQEAKRIQEKKLDIQKSKKGEGGLYQYHKVSARWVPKHLTAELKERHVDVCETLLWRYEAEGDGFLKHIITGDEYWVHYFQPETKRTSKE